MTKDLYLLEGSLRSRSQRGQLVREKKRPRTMVEKNRRAREVPNQGLRSKYQD